MPDQKLELTIEAVNKAKAAFTDIDRDLKKMKSQTARASAGMMANLKQLRQHWFAIAAAVTAAIVVIRKVTAAFMEKETAEMKLAVAMRNQGDFTREAFATFKDYAAQLQKLTAYGDEVTLAMMANLKTYNMTTEELKRATEATMDLATAKGMDLTAASELVGKAFVGETGTLARYGIIVEDGLKKTEKFDAVLKQINQRFGGSARAEIETYAGQWKQIANLWGDITEKVGLGLLKVLEAVQFAVGMVGVAFYTLLEKIIMIFRMLAEQAARIPIIGRQMSGVVEHLKTIEGGYKSAKESALEFTDANYKMLTSFGRVEAAVEKMGKGIKPGKPVEVGETDKELEDLRKKWQSTLQQLRDDMASFGLEEFDKQISDINTKMRDLIDEFQRIPGAKKVIEEWGESLKKVLTEKEKSKRLQEGMKAFKELEESLTASKISELKKRLLAVDDAAKKERDLLDVTHKSGVIGEEEFQAKIIEIRQNAAEQKLRINRENEARIREATINAQLAALDLAEKEGTTFHRDTIAERIRLMTELEGIQKDYLDTLDKTRDPSSWYAQSDAINKTRQEILALKDKLNPVQASLRQFADEATDVWKNVGEAVTRAFNNMTEALVEFTMSGKLNFKDFADSVIRDLVRIAYQQAITGPLAVGIGGFLQGLFGGMAGTAGAGAEIPGTPVMYVHAGGFIRPALAGSEKSYSIVPSLDLLPRRHAGGLSPNERIVINRVGERYVTEEQNTWLTGIARAMQQVAPTAVQGETHVHLTINALDSRSVSQTLVQHRDEIVGLVNIAYNKRGQRGPLGS